MDHEAIGRDYGRRSNVTDAFVNFGDVSAGGDLDGPDAAFLWQFVIMVLFAVLEGIGRQEGIYGWFAMHR